MESKPIIDHYLNFDAFKRSSEKATVEPPSGGHPLKLERYRED